MITLITPVERYIIGTGIWSNYNAVLYNMKAKLKP